MKRLICVAAMLALAGCAKTETSNAHRPAPPATTAKATTTAPAENTYPMTATILSRDPAKNMLNLENKEVPGKMMAMKMEYEVRDAKVGSLPPDGTAVLVTMHEPNGKYWIT